MSETFVDPFKDAEKRVFLSKVFFDSREVVRLVERTKEGLANYCMFPGGKEMVSDITMQVDVVRQKANIIFKWAENYVAIEHYEFTANELHNLFEIAMSMHNEISVAKTLQTELALDYAQVRNDPYLGSRLDLGKKNIHELTTVILKQKGKTPSLTGEVPEHVLRAWNKKN